SDGATPTCPCALRRPNSQPSLELVPPSPTAAPSLNLLRGVELSSVQFSSVCPCSRCAAAAAIALAHTLPSRSPLPPSDGASHIRASLLFSSYLAVLPRCTVGAASPSPARPQARGLSPSPPLAHKRADSRPAPRSPTSARTLAPTMPPLPPQPHGAPAAARTHPPGCCCLAPPPPTPWSPSSSTHASPRLLLPRCSVGAAAASPRARARGLPRAPPHATPTTFFCPFLEVNVNAQQSAPANKGRGLGCPGPPSAAVTRAWPGLPRAARQPTNI
ncbi:hypothetical protein SLA2020_087020, partial [Shorea laevis]